MKTLMDIQSIGSRIELGHSPFWFRQRNRPANSQQGRWQFECNLKFFRFYFWWRFALVPHRHDEQSSQLMHQNAQVAWQGGHGFRRSYNNSRGRNATILGTAARPPCCCLLLLALFGCLPGNRRRAPWIRLMALTLCRFIFLPSARLCFH